MRFASLGSGSRGNATLLEAGGSLLLVDCGFSVRETNARLARLGISAGQLSAILVTHEHTDHSSGVGRMSRRHQLPVYTSHGTYASGRLGDVHELRYFHSEAGFKVGAIDVMPVAVPHDAREPCQFVFRHGGHQLGVLTDLGNITPLVSQHYAGCHALLLECNHDPDMLRAGPYPENLKRRVGGEWGHLSNQQAADFLMRVQGPQLQHVVIAHISEKNNDRAKVMSALETVYVRSAELCWADQQTGFDWLQLR
jgi:phosphoribosyl 1,2-cyclic phosphodiesterase